MGYSHSALPTIISNGNLFQLILSMFSQIGGGILMGWFFIFLLEKSKSLWIPTLVHAILDYTVGFIGIIVAIITFSIWLDICYMACPYGQHSFFVF